MGEVEAPKIRDELYPRSDDGPGIEERRREDVVEPDYSGTDTGTGLGLAIVEEVVEAHCWEVTIAESERGGDRFEVTT